MLSAKRAGHSIFASAVSLSLALGSAPANASQNAFDQLVEKLRAVHGYEFDVEATEHIGTVTKAATMHVVVNLDDRSEQLAIIAGPHHGSVVTWTGGPEESVKLPGMLSLVPVHGPLRDSRFLSLRGNDIRVAELETILECYSQHRDTMVESPGPDIDGDPTVSIAITAKDGVICDGNDWEQEHAVTKDEVLISRTTGLPRRRMRYEGTTIVEEWDLRDITMHGGPELRPPDGSKQASTR